MYDKPHSSFKSDLALMAAGAQGGIQSAHPLIKPNIQIPSNTAMLHIKMTALKC